MASVAMKENQEQDQDEHQSLVLKALEALKKASEDIEANADNDKDHNSPSMKALLELETGSGELLSGDPHLSTLSHLLSRLKSLASSFHSTHLSSASGGQGLLSFLLRRRQSRSGRELSLLAGSIGHELQSWIDRETLDRLTSALRSSGSDDDTLRLLVALESRLACGFDRPLQDLLLRSGFFPAVESALSDPAAPKPVRDRSAAAVLALVRFNKDVFVGQVLMGPTVPSLIALSSPASLRALAGLVAAVRSPIVDEIQAVGGIPKLISLLAPSSAAPVDVRVAALECVMEMGYFGRKEAMDEMLEEGVIQRLAELQRSSVEMDGGDGVAAGGVGKGGSGERRPLARFAVQVEVGEGLRQREKRAFKLEVVRLVREAVTSPAEKATTVAEVLWGSTLW